jgi:hypothetical protein
MSDQGFSAPGGSFPPPPPVGGATPPPTPSPNYSAPTAQPSAAPNYGSGPVASAAVVRRGNGKLTAAGVLQIIQGALSGIFGLWLFSVTQSEVGGFVDDLAGGSLTFVAVLLVAIAVALIWVSVLCIKGRKGGWVTTVVFQSIFTFFTLIGLLGASSEDGSVGGGVLSTAYCAIALILAWSGGKQASR